VSEYNHAMVRIPATVVIVTALASAAATRAELVTDAQCLLPESACAGPASSAVDNAEPEIEWSAADPIVAPIRPPMTYMQATRIDVTVLKEDSTVREIE
jgi:hypothetical protein